MRRKFKAAATENICCLEKKMKKRRAFLKSVSLAVSLFLIAGIISGCKPETNLPSSVSYLEEYQNRWCYSRLSKRLRDGYDNLYKAVSESFDKDETIYIREEESGKDKAYLGVSTKLSHPLQSRQEAHELYTAFITDNPQFFYIGNLYSYEGYHSNGQDFYDTFGLVYIYDAKTRSGYRDEINAKVSALLERLPRSSQFETELALHDRLLEICSYDERTREEENPIDKYPHSFNIYGALIEGKAVCEGYARAMQLLLYQVGIPCTLVSGQDQNGVAHMWNFVTIDGLNYHLDPTWNDSGDIIRHSLFNLKTEDILLSHVIDAGNIGIDTCVSDEANYFNKRELYLNSFDGNEISQRIAAEIKKGAEKIELRFGPQTYASAQLLIYDQKVLTEKVNEILKDDGVTMWHYENFYQDDNQRTVYIEKSVKKEEKPTES